MPGKFLHRGCIFKCPCCPQPPPPAPGLGFAPPPTANTILKVGTQLVYLASDPFPVAPFPTCVGLAMIPPQPCSAIVWADGARAQYTRIGPERVLLQVAGTGSVGPAAPPGPPGTPPALLMTHNTIVVTDPDTQIKEA